MKNKIISVLIIFLFTSITINLVTIHQLSVSEKELENLVLKLKDQSLLVEKINSLEFEIDGLELANEELKNSQ